jgi:hypothetical protein
MPENLPGKPATKHNRLKRNRHFLYCAAALMKRDNTEITSDMTASEIIDVMDNYLHLAEKKLAEERLQKTEQNVISEILRLQREIEALHRDLENIKNKGENK